MKLKRGNPRALEGTVVIYVENVKPSSEKTRFPAALGSVSPLDLFIFKEDQVNPEELKEQKEYAVNGTKELEEELRKEINSEIMTPLAIAIIDYLPGPEHVSFFPGDVIFAGRAEGDDLSHTLIGNAATWYAINYGAQLYTAMEDLRKEEGQFQVNREPDSFNKYTPEGLVGRLTQLSGNLVFALQNGDERIRNETLLNFRELSQGSNFVREVSNMIDSINSNDSRGIELASKYIRMIRAVSKEDYLTASKLKKEIASMNGK